MSTIDVQFHGDFAHISNVSVPVEVMDSTLHTVAATTVQLGHSKPVQVTEPGLYLVRAELPSGQRVSTSVTIPVPPAGDPNAPVIAVLAPRDLSPHETTAWAYTLQGVQRPAGFIAEVTSSLPQSDAPTPSLGVERVRAYRNVESRDGAFRLEPSLEPPMGSTAPPGDPRIALDFVIQRPSLESTPTREWWPIYQELWIDGPLGPSRLLVAIAPDPVSQIILTVDEEESRLFPVRPLVRGGDPRADALLAYLTRGAFADARAIGNTISENDIRDILFQKRRDPDSAVVAAYYQLRAGSVEQPAWVKNLADWFRYIPDGAIQYAWCLMRQEVPDYPAARAYLMTAARRGIPMYSYGVRLLYDGLNLFAERDPEDVEVANAFRAVRRIAAVTDWRTAVTCLALAESPATGSSPPPFAGEH